MDGGIEATADAVTGAALARAVEPHAGEHGVAAIGLCQNCGTARIGAFCHRCGQSDHVHRSLGAIGHDLLHGVFHFEGKIWRTLPMLIFRPGELTRRYVEGERARFVSPLALYLFTVFLMFAVYSAVGPKDLGTGFVDGLAGANAAMEDSRNVSVRRLAAMEAERRQAVAAGENVVRLDRSIANEREQIRSLTNIQTQLVRERDDAAPIKTGWDWLDKGVAKIRGNPSLIAYKMQSSGYKFSWALILMSVPLVALLFLWRRGHALYDHAVFVTYSIGFMSLLAIVLEVALSIGVSRQLFWWTVAIVPPIHMFAQLRGAYSLRKRSALWRTVVLLWMAFWVVVLFVAGLLAMGMSG